MGTMNFSIPDEVKDAFNEMFKDENKSAIVAGLMRRAVEDRQRRRRSETLLEQMRRMHAMGRTYTDEEIRRMREEGRP